MGIKERRANEKQARLEQILDGAREMLFSHGIDNISMSGIAKKAELGVGTIYFYFQSKEEIFAALQEEGLALFYHTIQKIHICPIACDEKLVRIGRAFYTFCRNHKDYYDVINYFLSSSKIFFTPDLKNKIDMSGGKILDLIQQIIEQGVADNTFKQTDAKKYAVYFFAALHGVMQLKKLEKTALAQENHQTIYEFSLAQLMAGLKGGNTCSQT
ncbi:MAG: TetR/AcrR family transcriptional regulator [Desulfotignum sp.]|nr:TetR/AcrR family transcriptional regulator [Desulfotignum sp.]